MKVKHYFKFPNYILSIKSRVTKWIWNNTLFYKVSFTIGKSATMFKVGQFIIFSNNHIDDLILDTLHRNDKQRTIFTK